jgi:hypothetical protein
VLKKFRFSSSKATHPQALVVKITSGQSITIEETDPTPLESVEELIEALPETSPRFIILSYPLTLEDGRKSSPYVMIYFRPQTATQSSRMEYAGAVELVRNEAGVSRVIEIEELDELEDVHGLVTF